MIRALLAGILAAVCAAAQQPARLAVGQAVWRSSARTVQRTAADGSARPVQTDLYVVHLDTAQQLVARLWAQGRLGLVAYPAAGGAAPPAPLGACGPNQALDLDLAAGDYLLAVAGDPPAEGAYQLSLAPHPAPAGQATPEALPEAPADGGLPARGRLRLPHAVRSLDVSRDGDWLVACDDQAAWLYALASGTRYAVPAPAGPLLRVEMAPSGWAMLVVGRESARLLSLPELAIIADLPGDGELADATFTGPDLRVALLPAAGAVTVRSPVPGDLAGLPEAEGIRLAGDSRGQRLAVLRGDGQLALFDLGRRQATDSEAWPALPSQVALDPLRPVVLTAGASASRLWLAEADDPLQELPDLRAVAFGPNGEIAISDATSVLLRYQADEVECVPAAPADWLAMDDRGRMLVAATNDGTVTIWDTSSLAPDRVIESGAMARARGAYEAGMQAMSAEEYESAARSFGVALDLLDRQSEREAGAPQQACLALLRLSQCSFGLERYEESAEQAAQLERRAAVLTDEAVRGALVAIARYGRAEALWALGRHDEARPVYQSALDAGLDGERAEEARQRLAQ